MAIPLIDTILKAAGKAVDKIWMDKDKKEQLAFDKEKFSDEIQLALKTLEQNGELAYIEAEFKEAESERGYAHEQFGTATILKDFFLGRIILLGRAGIRWCITGFAMIQAHRIISTILTPEVIKSLAEGKLTGQGVWLVTLLVCSIISIPLFYVAGVSVEKVLKSRGIL